MIKISVREDLELTEDKLDIEFAIDDNNEDQSKSEESEEKKQSNRTTAEVSMNIIFDVYDPMTLKKDHFVKMMIPLMADIKSALFGEIQEKTRIYRGEGRKGLKSISEFNESQKEEEEEMSKIKLKKDLEVKTFVVQKPTDTSDQTKGKQKEFVINFSDFGQSELSKEPEIQITKEDDDKEKVNPFTQKDGTFTPPKINLNFSNNSKDSGNLYEMINQTNTFRMSFQSSSSGYSKENLMLDMTPDKPKTSSIDITNSSDKKNVLSDFKNTKLNLVNFDYSINSRPSFLDRGVNRDKTSKEEMRNWEDLSVNTNDLINSEGVSMMSDNEKQGLLEEVMDLDMDNQQKMLFAELLRQKSQKEADIMLKVLKKMPWVFKETLEKKKQFLIRSKRERKERRLNRGKEADWKNSITKGEFYWPILVPE